jgi:protein-S-isoprenylcysteine O-methyltransferase Ste14
LYSVGTALFIAFALMAANALLGVFAILAFVLLHLRVPAEEASLVAKFGDAYRQYMQTTGRYLPKL